MTERRRGKAAERNTAVDYGLLDALIGYHLRRAQASVFDDFLRTTTREKITPGHFGVLVVIEANRGLSQSALARALGIERSTMVAVIDALEARGLVERRNSTTDRRSYALTLTERGRALLKRLKPLVRQHEARIGSALSGAERAQLIDLLHRLVASPT
jgi:DNA-binding MarR family transcriptional regulator